MKKNIIALSSLVLLVSIILGGYYFGFKGDVASANPDYICVKSVSAQACTNVVWGAWQQDGTRTGIGTKATQVGYYHTRTSCESGYSKSSHQGSTSVTTSAANYMINNGNGSKLYSNWNQWASGRHSSNFTYSSTSCTLTQVDKITPVGTFK